MKEENASSSGFSAASEHDVLADMPGFEYFFLMLFQQVFFVDTTYGVW